MHACDQQRMVPVIPSLCNAMLDQRRFTNNTDSAIAKRLYLDPVATAYSVKKLNCDSAIVKRLYSDTFATACSVKKPNFIGDRANMWYKR